MKIFVGSRDIHQHKESIAKREKERDRERERERERTIGRLYIDTYTSLVFESTWAEARHQSNVVSMETTKKHLST
jgi:hypothetical protein